MKANCRLCQSPGRLRESHIIPRFVFQWMKDTGPGALRQATKPNVRRQDGLRERILCEKCEQLIGQDEKRFAERVFRPILENPREEIRYDESLIRFAVSLAWRVLVTEMGRDRAHRRFDQNLSDAELEWRQFLLRKGRLEKYDRFHIFLTELLQSSTQPISNLNQYLTRFTDGCVAMSESTCAIFVKFSRFVFWSEISEFDPSEWVGTRINCSAGILKEPQDVRDSRFGNFLLHRAKVASEYYWNGISVRQQALIADRFKEAAPGLVGTDFWRSLQADMEATIDFDSWVGRKIQPSETCPCGSGRPYNSCHGVTPKTDT